MCVEEVHVPKKSTVQEVCVEDASIWKKSSFEEVCVCEEKYHFHRQADEVHVFMKDE